MTGCGKHGKTIKLFSHSSHNPWKSLRDSHIAHRHHDEKKLSIKPSNQNWNNDAQYHYPGGPN
jgi:hypothetical protein